MPVNFKNSYYQQRHPTMSVLRVYIYLVVISVCLFIIVCMSNHDSWTPRPLPQILTWENVRTMNEEIQLKNLQKFIATFKGKSWFISLLSYRVSHETGQLVNSFECLLPYTVLDIKDFSQFNSLKKITQIYFT